MGHHHPQVPSFICDFASAQDSALPLLGIAAVRVSVLALGLASVARHNGRGET